MESLRRSCASLIPPGSFLIALTGVSLAFCLVLPVPWVEASGGGAAAPAGDDHGSPLSIVWKWGNFILLFGGLAWYLRRPLREFLQTRARGIEEGLASGKRAQQEAEAKMSAIETQLARMDEEIDGLKRQAARESEQERQRIIDSSQAEAERIVAMARREIEGMQRSARVKLKAEVARLAVNLAEERLQRDLEPSQDQRIISRFVHSLKETRS